MVLPVLGAIAGGLISAWGAKKAADTQADAARDGAAAQERMNDKNIAFQKETRDQTTARFDPFYQAGMNRLGGYGQAIDESAVPAEFNFEADPGYQWRLQQGMEALEGGAAARHGLNSGATQNALQRYGQGFASNEYGNAYNRWDNQRNNYMNRLGGLVDTGMSAAGQQANAANAAAGRIGQAYTNTGIAQNQGITGAGNAKAAGTIGMGNAINQGIGDATGAWQYNKLMENWGS